MTLVHPVTNDISTQLHLLSQLNFISGKLGLQPLDSSGSVTTVAAPTGCRTFLEINPSIKALGW
jgi:hypothetical protein